MIKLKKILAIIAALSLLTVLLFGCEPKPTTTNSEISEATSSEAVSDGTSSEPVSDDTSESMSEDTSSEPMSDGTSSEPTSDGTSSTATSTGGTSNAVSGTSSASTSKDTAVLFPGRAKNLNGRTIIYNTAAIVSTKPLDGAARTLRKLKAIEKMYNCKIVIDTTISESAKNTTIKASVLAGKPKVDIWYQNGYNTEFLPHYTSGTLQPLDGLKVIDFTDVGAPSVSELTNIGGKHYALGIGDYGIVASPVIFFNAKYLADCGINDNLYTVQNSGQWTWDKFASYCKTVSQIPGKTALYDSDGMLYNMIMYSYGTDYVIRDAKGKATFGGGTTAGLAALAYYKDLVAKKYVEIPVNAANGGSYFMGFWVGDGTGKAFLTGGAAFGATEYLMIEYGVKNYGSPGPDGVKENYGILHHPKRKASDAYAAYSDATLCGFMAIPYGVKKPAEVATIMNAIYSPSPNAAEAADDEANEVKDRTQMYTEQYAGALNELTGDDMVELKFKLVDMNVAKKFIYKFSFLGNGPGVSLDWIKQVSKIANGTADAGTVINSVSANYNSKLSNLFVIR